jgi:preprotein translocase subunit SecG
MDLGFFLMMAMNIVAIALISVVIIQGQTGAGLGAVFGGSDIYRTRRGIEKTLWQVTWALTIVFLILALITVMLS